MVAGALFKGVCYASQSDALLAFYEGSPARFFVKVSGQNYIYFWHVYTPTGKWAIFSGTGSPLSLAWAASPPAAGVPVFAACTQGWEFADMSLVFWAVMLALALVLVAVVSARVAR